MDLRHWDAEGGQGNQHENVILTLGKNGSPHTNVYSEAEGWPSWAAFYFSLLGV